MDRKEYQKQWARNNRDKTRANNKAWQERNPERAKEISRRSALKYAKSHREEQRARSANQRKKNPEAMKLWWKNNPEKVKEYRKKRREKRSAYNREWRRTHPGETKAHKHNRRTKETGAGGSFTAKEWFTLCFAVGFKCLKCGKVKKLTPDHVIPVSLGGSSFLHNIQPLCGSCNSSKHAEVIDYREKINVITDYIGCSRLGGHFITYDHELSSCAG